MITLRISLLAALLAVASLARADTPAAHGFDFLFGDWRVHYRLKRASGEWWEFDGTCSNRGLMAGASNVEEHVFTKPSGISYGVALRAYDAENDHWSIWWLDSRYMSGPLQAPNIGRFENGVGLFYADFTDNGKVKTWDTNWIMLFERRR